DQDWACGDPGANALAGRPRAFDTVAAHTSCSHGSERIAEGAPDAACNAPDETDGNAREVCSDVSAPAGSRKTDSRSESDNGGRSKDASRRGDHRYKSGK